MKHNHGPKRVCRWERCTCGGRTAEGFCRAHVYRVRALGFDPLTITLVEVARLPALWAEREAAHEAERERLAAESWPLARGRKQRTATFSATMAARLEAIGYRHGDTNPIAWLFDRLQEAERRYMLWTEAAETVAAEYGAKQVAAQKEAWEGDRAQLSAALGGMAGSWGELVEEVARLHEADRRRRAAPRPEGWVGDGLLPPGDWRAGGGA